jgi:hypothetical protein
MFLVRCVKTCNLRRRYAYTWGLAWQKAAE